MESRDYEKLERMLCEELEKIIEKDDVSLSTLDMIDKLTHSIKSIKRILSEDDDGGYSQNGIYTMRGEYNGYDRDSSYRRRKRDRMGRYSRDGYNDHENTISELEDLQRDVKDEKERDIIRKCIEKLREE